jgi:hypothetical protein
MIPAQQGGGLLVGQTGGEPHPHLAGTRLRDGALDQAYRAAVDGTRLDHLPRPHRAHRRAPANGDGAVGEG